MSVNRWQKQNKIKSKQPTKSKQTKKEKHRSSVYNGSKKQILFELCMIDCV